MKKNFLIVVADYYKDISQGLLKSANKTLPRSCKIKTISVPGVFEIIKCFIKRIRQLLINQIILYNIGRNYSNSRSNASFNSSFD